VSAWFKSGARERERKRDFLLDFNLIELPCFSVRVSFLACIITSSMISGHSAKHGRFELCVLLIQQFCAFHSANSLGYVPCCIL